MKINELVEIFKNKGVPSDWYSLHSPNEDSCCLIHHENEVEEYWEVFFFERGVKRDRVIFLNESEACSFFLEWVSESYLSSL